jgi:hypothetical protein
MAVLESVMAVLLLVAAEAKEAAEAEERSDPARSLHMAKRLGAIKSQPKFTRAEEPSLLCNQVRFSTRCGL